MTGVSWRVVQNDAGGFRVEVAEVWAVWHRKDGEVHTEINTSVADVGSTSKTKSLTKVSGAGSGT